LASTPDSHQKPNTVLKPVLNWLKIRIEVITTKLSKSKSTSRPKQVVSVETSHSIRSGTGVKRFKKEFSSKPATHSRDIKDRLAAARNLNYPALPVPASISLIMPAAHVLARGPPGRIPVERGKSRGFSGQS
jgi:hypothetical protein